MKKNRMANVELLRILAMLMVITLHYLDKGLLLPNHIEGFGISGGVSWFFQSISIVAVNVYVLITGYFMVDAKFRISKIIQLIAQVLFYSMLIPLIMIGVGILQLEDITMNQWVQYCLPILSKQYWFATSYVMLYFFSPILNIAIKNMKKVQLQLSIGLLIGLFVIPKTMIPVELAIDTKGHDVVWFICLYLIAAYIKRYGISYLTNFKRSIFCYLFSVIFIFTYTFLVSWFVRQTGLFGGFAQRAYDYNHIVVLMGSISLFYSFLYLNIKDGGLSKLIIRIAPYTFGVYLFHEHIELRYLWVDWFHLPLGDGSISFIIQYVISIFFIFALGVLIDFVRSIIFMKITLLLKNCKITKGFIEIDRKIN